MRTVREWLSRLWGTLRGRRGDDDLAEEIRIHLALAAEEAVRRGHAPAGAARLARLSAGHPLQALDALCDQRGLPWLDDLRRDAAYAIRAARRTPSFTAAIVLTIALGIGAAASIYGVVKAVLLEPLPFRDPERLVQIVENVPAGESFRGVAIRMPAMNIDEFEWWRTHATVFSHMAVVVPQPRTLRTREGNVRLGGARVSPELFEMRGVPPLLGRGLYPDEARPGANVAVLSASTWRRHFGADEAIVNGTIVLDDVPYTVVGVMPREFGDEDFWTPYVVEPSRPGAVVVVPVTARLRDGISMEGAAAEINLLGHRLRDAQFDPDAAPRFELTRIQDWMVARVRPALQVLVGAVALVLLLVCANVANLLMTRGARRTHEIATRLALGASRGRLVRQVLTESLVFALTGGVGGVCLALAGVHALKRLATVELPAGFGDPLGLALLPRVADVAVDGQVLAVALVTASLAGLLFGTAPALRFARSSACGVGGHAGASTASASPRRVQLLAAIQVGLATTLLVGAGLLMHSFVKLTSIDSGFDPTHVLSFDLVLPEHALAEHKLEVAQKVARRISALPDVIAAGFTDGPPLSNRTARPYGAYTPPPRPDEADERAPEIDQRLVSPDYLRALGVRLIAGRWLNERDGHLRPAPILVNRVYARYYFGEQNAVGAILPTRSGPAVVAGVVDDVRFAGADQPAAMAGFVDPRHPLVINSEMLAERGRQRNAEGNRLFLSGFTGGIAYAVRVQGNPLALVPEVRRIAADVEPSAAVDSAMPMERVVGGLAAQPRFYAILLGAFALLAAIIAAVGVYGVIAHASAQRTREIGIRVALGATRREVLGLVMRQGVLLTTCGVAAGVLGALAMSRQLTGMLFGVSPFDMPTYIAVSLGFLIVALLACYVPARRATQVDPLIALRVE